MKLAMIQMLVQSDKQANLIVSKHFVEDAAKKGADLVVLPEMFSCPYQTSCFPEYAELEVGPTFEFLSKLANDNCIYLIAGSIPEMDSCGKIYNTCYVFNRDGKKIAKHRKLHLFDIDIEGRQYFKESDTLSAGSDLTVFDSEFCKIGIAICYDARFPELIRLMVDNGAKLIVVPAAFNMTTGPAHWELLFRSRAVDNQVFMAAVSSARNPSADYKAYGNSMIVSPWGDVLCRLQEEEGIEIYELDLSLIEKIRAELPLLKQRRKDLYELRTL